MWAIIRLVVVLPLVPVTATTGIRGVIVVGRGPARRRATRAAAALTASSTSPAGSASSTSATALPTSRRAVHATGRRPRPGAGRWSVGPGPPAARSRLVRHRPHQPGQGPGGEPLAEPGSGAPGRAFLSPMRRANRWAFSVDSEPSALMSRSASPRPGGSTGSGLRGSAARRGEVTGERYRRSRRPGWRCGRAVAGQGGGEPATVSVPPTVARPPPGGGPGRPGRSGPRPGRTVPPALAERGGAPS